MLYDIGRWELNIQLFSDLLISKNGVQGTLRTLEEPQSVDLHLCHNEFDYKDDFPINRIAAGAFLSSLEHLFMLKYKRKINYSLYGKPSPLVFEYVSKFSQIFSLLLFKIFRARIIKTQGNRSFKLLYDRG
jgi:hypothetical protein